MTNDDYCYVDSEMLIFEVQKRPLLYDISLPDYNDRVKKSKCWDEVCEQVIQNWEDLSPAEKNNRGKYQLFIFFLQINPLRCFEI